MERGRRGRSSGHSQSFYNRSGYQQNRGVTKRCTLCKMDGHQRFECMREFRFVDEDGKEWVKWTLTKSEYELIKREREKERVKKEMLLKKERLKDEMRMKREIEYEIAREKKERKRNEASLGSVSVDDSDESSEIERSRGKDKSKTRGDRKTSVGNRDEGRMMNLLESMMARQDEMMRELEEVKGLKKDSRKMNETRERRRSTSGKALRKVNGGDDDVVMGVSTTRVPNDEKRGAMVKATYVPRAALDEDEYNEEDEVVGAVPIATEELCNALNRAWSSREKRREKKDMGPVRLANVERMVKKHAENIDESVRMQAMINVVCAYGGEVLDDMGFEELVRELGVIYK